MPKTRKADRWPSGKLIYRLFKGLTFAASTGCISYAILDIVKPTVTTTPPTFILLYVMVLAGLAVFNPLLLKYVNG